MASLKTSSKLHFAMFPSFAYGHMIAFLHLCKKLAERGHRVSFLLPRVALPKMEQLSLNQDLIQFIPLDVSIPIYSHVIPAADQAQDQVETVIRFVKPDCVFFDFGFWVSALARHLGIKSIYYAVVGAASHAIWLVPSCKVQKDWTTAEILQTPIGYLTSTGLLQPHELAQSNSPALVHEAVQNFKERLNTCMEECDAIAVRTCPQIEGYFCDYIAQQYAKPVLLAGSLLSHTQAVAPLEDQWAKWLSNFKPSSVVFCAIGSMITLEKSQFQELLLGFELAQLPFLVALRPPQGCATIDEALPEGFLERVQGRGLVYGDWVPQLSLLNHPSIGCFVSHGAVGSMWESFINDPQIVLLPYVADQNVNTRLMVEELKVAVEIQRAENGWVTKENLSKAIKSVMDDSEFATLLRSNHANLKDIIQSQDMQGGYFDSFNQNLQSLLGIKDMAEEQSN